VQFRLHEGRYEGQLIYTIRTDASSVEFAEANQLVYVPLLNQAASMEGVNSLYLFDNRAGKPAWSPFWNHFTWRWADEANARVITSSAAGREAEAGGELELFNGTPDSHPNGFVVNCPVPILAPNTFAA
jgi:hypothetical protein